MKIEMRRVFGNTTLTLTDEADDYGQITAAVLTMEAILNAAEEGPKIEGEALKTKRAAIMAEGGNGKIPQGAAAPQDDVGPWGGQPANAVETDSAGYPWDAVRHSANRTKTMDGRWRMRKGSLSN